MNAATIFVVLAVCFAKINCSELKANLLKAEVSENCKWGRTDAAECCRSIPNGDLTKLANPKECSSFFICRNNKPALYPCPPQEVWSVPKQICVESSNPRHCEQVA